MCQKWHRPEQIIHKLRQAEIEISKGATVAQAAKGIGVTEHTHYGCRVAYGGMRVPGRGETQHPARRRRPRWAEESGGAPRGPEQGGVRLERS